MSLKKTLTLTVIISILVTAIPASIVVVYFTKEDILNHESLSLLSLTRTQVEAVQSRLEQSLPKLSGLAREIQKTLAPPLNENDLKQFAQTMSLYPDGVWRNKKANYDGDTESGIFLPDSDTLTEADKALHIRIKHVMDHFGSAATGLHENVWYLSLLRSEIIFDKTFPDFAFEQQAGNDYTHTPWVTNTSPENNPERSIRFTRPLFDPVPKKWMVSAVYPLYQGDKWMGSLGEDMQLSNVLAALLGEHQLYPGTQHFLLDKAGHFVLAGDWQQELESSSSAEIDLSGEPVLTNLLAMDLHNASPELISNSLTIDGRDYMVFGMLINPVQWRYFKLVPIEKIVEPAKKLLYAMGIVVFLVSAVCGGLISGVINRYVIKRIQKFARRIRQYESGNKSRISSEITGDDEIALAAKEFDVMAERVERYVHDMDKARDELATSEQRWMFALEGAGDGVWEWNIETGENLFSAQWRDMLGYPEGELQSLFSNFEDLIHPDDLPIFRAAVEAYLCGKQPIYSAEFRMRCKDGSWKWILSRGMVTERGSDNHPVTMIGTHTDISYLKQIQKEQSEFTERLRGMLSDSPIAVRIAKDKGHKVVFANRRYAELVNKPEDDVLGIDPQDYYVDPSVYSNMIERVESGENVENELTYLSIPGQGQKWALASYSRINFESESCIIGWFYDVTDRLRAEELIRLHASVFDNAWEGIVITNEKNHVIAVNKAFTDITGFEQEELVGRNPRVLSSGRQDENFYSQMWESLHNTGHWRGEVWNRRKNGEVYAEILTISAVKNDKGIVTHYVGIFADITEMKKTERELENMAHYDSLTHLPNRSLLSDRLAQALVRAQRNEGILAVCFMDLDGFKPVNDRFGHEAGDELLVEISKRLELNVRSGDTVARLGGDEFVILITQANIVDDLDPILSRLIQAVAEPIKIGETIVCVTASIGVAIYPADNVDAETLLRHADLAMYEAKQSGRNGYHIFDASLDRQMHEQHKQIERLRFALENHEFILFYQPKVNLRTGDVVGFEALIRWQHPVRGLLAPHEFLPYMESTDLIVQVGDWVISQALSQLEAWQKQGLSLQVSVNVAARQIQDVSFIDKLKWALASHPSVSPALLELEILETSALETYQASQVIQAAVQNTGVSFALDDFGTGYSSLAHLKQLSAKTLKIDQTFVRDMLDDLEDEAIVAGVIELAKVFGRHVVAEGVETLEHGDKLLTMGCDIAQGFGISRPMPVEQVLGWVEEYRAEHFHPTAEVGS